MGKSTTIGVMGALLVACGSGASDSEPEAAGDPSAPTLEASGLRDIDPADGFQVDEGTFMVQPHQEGTYCVRIPIPEHWQGRDLVLIGQDVDVPEFTHHYFMTYDPAPLDSDEPVPCEGSAWRPFDEATASDTDGLIGAGKFLFGAGVGLTEMEDDRDDNYGRLMPAGGHLVTNHHVLNFSDDVIEMGARFNLYVRDASEVPYPISTLNCLSTDISVPAQSEVDITATCIAPFDLELVELGSHAHQYLDYFTAWKFVGGERVGEPIYGSGDWDSPDIVRVDPIRLRAGEGIQFNCHYVNETEQDVVYGLGLYNEMCATMNGYAYPPGREYQAPPNLGTLITNNDVPAPLIDTDLLPIPF